MSPGLASRARAFAPLLVLALAAIGDDAAAQSRRLFINGHRLSDAEAAALSQRHCAFITDGRYWMNMQTGAWGYAGNARIQGYLGDPCRQGAAGGGNAHLGPYATMRRANEVANEYRARGYSAVAFHNGDGYYVNVKR